MFEQYSTQLFLLAIFFMMVYAVVEVIKNIFLALPDKWGNVFREGLPKEINRWITFAIAYGLAWSFDFKFASLVFQSINGERASLPDHINYFVVACLLFVGAKWIYEQISTHYKILSGKNEKQNT